MHLSRRSFVRSAAGLAGLGAATALAPPVLAQASRLNGLDVSDYQGTVNWTAVKNAGNSFAFTKATEGTGFTARTFAANWAGMKRVGLVRGAYHYGRPSINAVAQADHFVNVVRPTHGDLQLVLDIEVTDGKTPAQVWAWTQAFLARIKARTGRPGIIYTYYYFWRDSMGNPTSNLNCPLWIATYGPSPLIPQAWTTWTFWQYSSTGRVAGVSGNVDVDYFNGDSTVLRRLTLP